MPVCGKGRSRFAFNERGGAKSLPERKGAEHKALIITGEQNEQLPVICALQFEDLSQLVFIASNNFTHDLFFYMAYN